MLADWAEACGLPELSLRELAFWILETFTATARNPRTACSVHVSQAWLATCFPYEGAGVPVRGPPRMADEGGSDCLVRVGQTAL